MATIVSAAFSGGSDGDNLTGYTPETGSAPVKHSSYAGDQCLTGDGFARGVFHATNEALYVFPDALGSADYYVEAVMRRRELNGGSRLGIAGRIDTSANTFYFTWYNQTTGQLHLFKRVDGSATELGTPYTFTWFDEVEHTIRLTMTGSSLEVTQNGTSRITATDSAITAAGYGGLFSHQTSNTTTPDLTWTSFLLDGTAPTPPQAPFNPPKKNEDLVVRVALRDANDPRTFKVNPTIAAGDWKVDKDGGGLTNLATLPSVNPSGSQLVELALSPSEMNGDVVTVVGIDQTNPKEWGDFVWSVPTTQ